MLSSGLSPQNPRLEALGLGKQYQGQWLFHSWNMTLDIGQGLALTGPNGSGKSTLLQCLGGLIRPDTGTLTWGGREEPFPACSLAAPYLEIPSEYTLDELVRFHFAVNPGISGLDPNFHLEQSGLDMQSNRRLKQYSSGMIQKVKLVLALFTNAPLLLLDEPHSHLDRQAQAWFQELLAKVMPHRVCIMASNDPQEYRQCTQFFELG